MRLLLGGTHRNDNFIMRDSHLSLAMTQDKLLNFARDDKVNEISIHFLYDNPYSGPTIKRLGLKCCIPNNIRRKEK